MEIENETGLPIETISAEVIAVGTKRDPAYKILIDWRNKTNSPVRQVYADITGTNAQGRKTFALLNCQLYSVPESSPGIAPGETYTEPRDAGISVTAADGEPVDIEIAVGEVK